MRGSETFAGLFEAGAEALCEARGHFVGALALLAEQVKRAAEAATSGQFVNAARGSEQTIADQAGDGFAQVGDVLVELAAGLHDDFGGGGGRGGAHVGDEIGDGEIGFVADAGDNRNLQSAMARATISSLNAQRSSSEPPPRARMMTSTSLLRLKYCKRFDDFLGRTFALHAHRIDVRQTLGNRRRRMRIMSRTAAPRGEVIRPMRRGSMGSGFFRSCVNRPSASRRFFSCSKASCSAPSPTGSMVST